MIVLTSAFFLCISVVPFGCIIVDVKQFPLLHFSWKTCSFCSHVANKGQSKLKELLPTTLIYRIMKFLEWRTVYALTRGLQSNERGKNNKIKLEWAHKQFVTSTNIISFLTRHNQSIKICHYTYNYITCIKLCYHHRVLSLWCIIQYQYEIILHSNEYALIWYHCTFVLCGYPQLEL